MIGPVEIMLYRTRDGRCQARVTMTDPESPDIPCQVPAQLVIYTEPCESEFWCLSQITTIIERAKDGRG